MTMDPVFFALKVYGIVIIVSFLCAAIIWGIVHVLSAMGEKTAAKVAVSVAPLPAKADVTKGIPPEHVAVIAAAAFATFGPAAILRIEHVGRRSAWVAGGRLTHQTSHTPSRRR